jgi:hypothetical protein
MLGLRRVAKRCRLRNRKVGDPSSYLFLARWGLRQGVLAPNAKSCPKVVPQPSDNNKTLTAIAIGCPESPAYGRPMRLGWAKLLMRVFDQDLSPCPNCGGELRVVAAILQRQAIEKILNHLGLDLQPPPPAPARGQMAF